MADYTTDCMICYATKSYPIHLVCCKQFVCMDCLQRLVSTTRTCCNCRSHLSSEIYPDRPTTTRPTTTPAVVSRPTGRQWTCRTCGLGGFNSKDTLYAHVRGHR